MDAGKVVLITGATGAVGSVISQAAAATGARLALTGRRMDALGKLGQQLGLPDERMILHRADLTKANDVRTLADTIAGRWEGVDVLLHIAGGWRGGMRLADVTEEDWDATMDMNLRSAFLINRAVLPHMAKRGWGRIVNVASRAAVSARPRQAAYNVSKAAIVALTASIAAEYCRQGIAANVILPSIIDTPNNRVQMPDADFSRWVKPEHLASIMLFLGSEAGGCFNGASIPVYGGV